MVRPCGSNTDGFNVTNTRALYACDITLNWSEHSLEHAIDALQLSARSTHRILRVARTIADLADSADIETPHLAEAIGYRRLDRGR